MSDDKRQALEDAIDRTIEYAFDMGIARTEATVKFALENRERYRVQVLAMFDAQQSRIEELEKAKAAADSVARFLRDNPLRGEEYVRPYATYGCADMNNKPNYVLRGDSIYRLDGTTPSFVAAFKFYNQRNVEEMLDRASRNTPQKRMYMVVGYFVDGSEFADRYLSDSVDSAKQAALDQYDPDGHSNLVITHAVSVGDDGALTTE